MPVRVLLTIILSCLFVTPPVWAQVSPESAEKYNEGQDLYKKRRYQEALQAFDEAVKLDGNNAQAYRAMGKTHQKLRDYDKAIESYRMAVTVKPDYLEAYYELGNLQLVTLKKYTDAQASFQKILDIDPDFQGGAAHELLKAAYAQQGTAYLRRKNYKKAASEYENATQLDPTDATLFYNLGLAHRYARNYSSAEQAFTTAVDLDPQYAKAHRALGDLYRITKKNSQAIRSYTRAIDSDPNCEDARNINAYLNLAKVYTGIKQPQKAVSTLTKAVSVAPTNKKSDVYVALGFAHAESKNHTSAINAYTQALKLDSKNAEAYYRRAVSYFETKQYQSALNSARQATSSRKFTVPAHVIMGDVYDAWRADGWKEKAIEHYKKGLNDRRYKKYCEDKIDRILNPMGTTEEGAPGAQ